MKGRVLNIKKTTILRLSFILSIILFVSASVLGGVFLEDKNTWFFFFCFFVGCHLLIKSALFHLDSSCLFGHVLFYIGIFYFYCIWFDIIKFLPVFILLSFAVGCFFTHCIFDRPFQLFLSFSIFFVDIGLLLLIINLISFWIFLAIIVFSVLLLVVRFFTIK